MFCDACGAQMGVNQRQCAGCGKVFGPPVQGRVARNLNILGGCWIGMGLLHLIPGMIVMALFRHPDFPPGMPPFVHDLVQFMGVVLSVSAAAGIVVGIGLLQKQSWGRMGALILSFLFLIKIPLGTALGIYSLWALLPEESAREYESLSAQRFQPAAR